jgi:uncharacterized phosphosugar-binding protein
MNVIKEYFNTVQKILDDIYRTQEKNIKLAAQMIVDASIANKNIYAFGSNHAGLLAQELFYRTGGLAIINPILVPGLKLDAQPITLTTSMERLVNYGKAIVESAGLKEEDVLIVHSVSGRNNVSIEVAMCARQIGAKVIVLTNMEYSSKVTSRHSSGKRLYDVADLVLDNCGCFGDAAIEVQGLPEKVGPTSTVAGAAILNAVVVEVVQLFSELGVTPPVFISSNVEGGDEHNKKILQEYKENIKYM